MTRGLLVAAALALGACAADDARDPIPTAGACRADLPVGAFEEFANLGEETEGVAFGPDGRLYVSAQGSESIWAFDANGQGEKIATAPSVLGLAFRGGDLFVAGFETHEIYRVKGGAADVYAGPVSQPNFITVTPWGSLLVSNDFADLISEATGPALATWTTAVPSPNGMGFDDAGENLYVVSTFSEPANLWHVALDGKKAGKATAVATFDGAPTPDGLAVAQDGTVYVALNVAGRLAKVDPKTGAITEVAKGLVFPASLAFGRGGFDPCSVYVTQLFGKGIHRVSVGVAGARLY